MIDTQAFLSELVLHKMSLEVHISEPDEFNCQELHTSIAKVASDIGINDFEYNVDCISGKKANYIANVFRVQIRDTDKVKNSVSVIVKTLVNTKRQELFHKLHEREVSAYNHVINKFKELQNVLYEHEKLVFTDCLFTNVSHSNEVIILEDLKANGFEIEGKLDQFQVLEFEEVSAVLSELAKFHALSFVFEKQDRDKFNEVKSEFDDLLYQDHFLNKTKLLTYFMDSFEISKNKVTDDDAKKKLDVIQTKLIELLQMYTRADKTNVLCHGDCWVNNMMFKSKPGVRTKVCFIDFQAMRYANPLTDIMYFLLMCTNSAFRFAYSEELKMIYYDNFKVYLNKFNINADDIYKRDDFHNDFEEYLPYGFLIAMTELRIVTAISDDDLQFMGSSLQLNLEEAAINGESELFKLRINDVVKEAIDNGVLDKLVEKINNL